MRIALLILAIVFPFAATGTATDTNTLALVAAVVKANGGEYLPRIYSLRFQATTQRAGMVIRSTTHEWRVRHHYDLITVTGKVWSVSTPPYCSDPHAQTFDASWIESMHWLLLPQRLAETGVVVQSRPRLTVDGNTYEVLQVSFSDSATALPGCTLYLDPVTYWLKRWRYVDIDGVPHTGTWSSHRKINGLILATEYTLDDRQISLTNVKVGRERPALLSNRAQFLIIFIGFMAWIVVWTCWFSSSRRRSPGTSDYPRGDALAAVNKWRSWRGPL